MRNFSTFFLSIFCFLAFPLTFQGQTLSADNDGDGWVTSSDLMILLSQYGECSKSLSADLDGDGCVSTSDLMTFLSQFGECSFANTFSGNTVFSDWEGGPEMCGVAEGYYAYQSLVFDGCGFSSTLTSNPVDGNSLTFTLGDFVLESYECWESNLGDYRQYTGGEAFLHDGETLIATFQDVSFEADVDYSNTMEGAGTAVLVEEDTDPVYFAEYGNQVTFTFVGSNPVVQVDCGTYETVIIINPFICDDLDANGICDEFEAAPCGDLISHDGYDYSTVLIGDQCWFSENCR